MRSFASTFPELAFDLGSELRATGRADIARELEASTVKTVSYDPETDAGLIALEPQRGLNTVERRRRAETRPGDRVRRRALRALAAR